MSRYCPSVAAPPPEVDAKLSGLGINVDQRKRLMIAARLGIGPMGTGLPGPKGVNQAAAPPRARSRSPQALPGPAGSSGYNAAQAAAAERERRRRDLQIKKKDDDDEMDLNAFMGGCKKAAQKATQEKERQRLAVEQKAKEEALQAELRTRRHREENVAAAAAMAAKAARAAKSASTPGQPTEEEVLAMLRGLNSARGIPPVQLSQDICSCGQVFVQGSKFCSECGAKRPAPQAGSEDASGSKPARHFREEAAAAPAPEERRETSEEVRRKEERRQLRREEKRRKKAEKARQRELADGEVEDDDGDEEESSASEQQKKLKAENIAANFKGDAMRAHWGEGIKGMVSNNYKGFSDADLERRFSLAAGGPAGSGGREKLMSEVEVLAMLRKPKAKR